MLLRLTTTAGFFYVGSRISWEIRMRYLGAAIRQNIGVIDNGGTGSLASALGADLNAIQDAVSHKLSIALSSIDTLIATYAFSFSLQWKLALSTLCFFLILALLYLWRLIAVRCTGCSVQAQNTGSTLTEEALNYIRSVTALVLHNHVINSHGQELVKGEKASYTLNYLMGTMVAVIVGIGYFKYGVKGVGASYRRVGTFHKLTRRAVQKL
ncbi:hypothetical protein AB5N19_05228 [Seiridium cardinale]